MKKMMISLITTFVFAFASLSQAAEKPVVYSLGQQTARALFSAGGVAQSIQCNYRLVAWTGGTGSEKNGKCTITMVGDLAGFITQFSLGDKELLGPGDPPLPKFPLFECDKITDFRIDVEKVLTSSGLATIYGNYSTDLFAPGTPIGIELYPDWMPVFIYDPTGNTDYELSWKSELGSGGGCWDPVHKGFAFWVPPTVPFIYTIVDRKTGLVIDRGGPLYYSDLPNGIEGAAVNVTQKNGVIGVDMTTGTLATRGWVYLDKQTLFDTGKGFERVYMVEIPKDREMYAYFWLPGASATVETTVFVPQGNMPVLDATYYEWTSPSGPGRDCNVYVPSSPNGGKIIFRVTKTDSARPFYLYFSLGGATPGKG